MTTQTAKARPDYVTQFSVFTPNRLGRLRELVGLLGSREVHVLALTVVDTSDSAIIRMVVDDPDRAREVLTEGSFPFSETRILVVEVTSADLVQIMSAMLEAELNVNYMYSFIPHPHGKSRLAVSVENNDLAEQALNHRNFKTLRQTDLSR